MYIHGSAMAVHCCLAVSWQCHDGQCRRNASEVLKKVHGQDSHGSIWQFILMACHDVAMRMAGASAMAMPRDSALELSDNQCASWPDSTALDINATAMALPWAPMAIPGTCTAPPW